MDATFDYQRWQIANRTRNQHQAQRIAARLTRARTLVTQIVQELVAVDPHREYFDIERYTVDHSIAIDRVLPPPFGATENGFEAYFLRIARAFENGLPPADWYKMLVAG